MSMLRVLRNDTPTLVSYPRVGTSGEFLRKQPASVTVRIGTPAVSLPSTEQGASVETALAAVTAAAVEGDDALAIATPGTTTKSTSDTSNHDPALDPQPVGTLTLDRVTTYDITASFGWLSEPHGGGVIEATVDGTITAVVTTDGTTATIVSQSTTYTSGPNGPITAIDLIASGLTLSVSVHGAAGHLLTPHLGQGTISFVATPRTAGVTTPIAGRRYILSGSEIDDEVEVRFVTSAELKLAEPLVEDVPAGTSILGWACTKALTAQQTATEGPGVAIWTATFADGTTVTWAEQFKIVRRLVWSTLTPTSLTRAYPRILSLRSAKDPSLEKLITAAWEHRVEPALAAHNIDPEDIISVERLEPLHAIACLLQIATGHESVSDNAFARIADRWQQIEQQTFASKDWWEAPQTSDPAVPPPEPKVRNGIRVRR